MSGQVEKNMRGEIWLMAENYMLILLLNVMSRVNWTGPYSYIFPLKYITL